MSDDWTALFLAVNAAIAMAVVAGQYWNWRGQRDSGWLTIASGYLAVSYAVLGATDNHDFQISDIAAVLWAAAFGMHLVALIGRVTS